jgi:hypothetical protein
LASCSRIMIVRSGDWQDLERGAVSGQRRTRSAPPCLMLCLLVATRLASCDAKRKPREPREEPIDPVCTVGARVKGLQLVDYVRAGDEFVYRRARACDELGHLGTTVVAVFGPAGVGKSRLLNSLGAQPAFPVSPRHDQLCTRGVLLSAAGDSFSGAGAMLLVDHEGWGGKGPAFDADLVTPLLWVCPCTSGSPGAALHARYALGWLTHVLIRRPPGEASLLRRLLLTDLLPRAAARQASDVVVQLHDSFRPHEVLEGFEWLVSRSVWAAARRASEASGAAAEGGEPPGAAGGKHCILAVAPPLGAAAADAHRVHQALFSRGGEEGAAGAMRAHARESVRGFCRTLHTVLVPELQENGSARAEAGEGAGVHAHERFSQGVGGAGAAGALSGIAQLRALLERFAREALREEEGEENEEGEEQGNSGEEGPASEAEGTAEGSSGGCYSGGESSGGNGAANDDGARGARAGAPRSFGGSGGAWARRGGPRRTVQMVCGSVQALVAAVNACSAARRAESGARGTREPPEQPPGAGAGCPDAPLVFLARARAAFAARLERRLESLAPRVPAARARLAAACTAARLSLFALERAAEPALRAFVRRAADARVRRACADWAERNAAAWEAAAARWARRAGVRAGHALARAAVPREEWELHAAADAAAARASARVLARLPPDWPALEQHARAALDAALDPDRRACSTLLNPPHSPSRHLEAPLNASTVVTTVEA